MRESRHALRPTRRQGFRHLFDDDIAAEGLSPLFARAVFWFPVIGLFVMLAIFAASRPLFYWITQEDRPLEWLQFLLCLVTAVVALAAAARYASIGVLPAAFLMGLFGLGMLGLAGEEISWGQRVLGLATPEGLAEANRQSETNIHNLSEAGIEVGDLFKVLEFLICVGGVGLALYVRGTRNRVPAFVRLLAPPLVTVPCLVTMAGYQAAQYLVVPDTWDAVARLQELAELAMYVGLATLALVVFTGARRRPYDEEYPRITSPLTAADLRLPVTVTGLAAIVTIACAVLSFFSGIDPGNI